MPGEELIQRNYVVDGKLKGEPFGGYELLELGATTVNELISIGLLDSVPTSVDFPFSKYKAPKRTKNTRPDAIYISHVADKTTVLCNKEVKKPTELNTDTKKVKAIEQALYASAVLGTKVSVITDGTQYIYLDSKKSLSDKELVLFQESRDFNPAVLEELISNDVDAIKNPGELAEKVWQAIWHATKEEPKQCLMTFVEIFILKFLSDNLPESVLPKRFSFYELAKFNENEFKSHYGKTQIEYYVQEIRNQIKSIFKEKEVVTGGTASDIFGINTIVSPTSLINGFAFLKSSSTSLDTFNRTFLEILGYFNAFGGLQNIDPEFKLRLYETFLKKTVRQQKLGQFFTPRNIVKSIIDMAELNKLPDNSVVLDPAAGVGGFLLEPLIDSSSLLGNITFENGDHKSRIKLIGADCDQNTNILAKANMLIHLSESLRDPQATISTLNKLMAESFVILNSNQHLGTLEYPVDSKVDVILTNPPYVTQGSKIYKEEISNISGLRNGFDLKEYYSRSGLGLEALFLRYVSGALKPGGIAFVIVPQGLLTRTEGTTKEKILSECNVIASISLPRNAFYSTPQKTYILVLEKRKTAAAYRPKVFCAIATSVGESLDARRIALPNENDLQEISKQFICHRSGKELSGEVVKNIKIVESNKFMKDDRWDVYRFWSDDDLVELGEREEAVSRVSFLDEIQERFIELTDEIKSVEAEIKALTSCSMRKVLVSDEQIFNVRRGKRVTRKDGDENPGPIPVYSGKKDPSMPLCRISKKFAQSKKIPIEEKPIITVNANGSVGAVFLRHEECVIHDDVMILEVLDESLDLEYSVHALRAAIAEGNYEYEAKLYNRVKEISFDAPIDTQGELDLEHQQKIASAYKKFEVLKQSVGEMGLWALGARVKD
ncbi:hypothetical protein GCM10007938_03380 [Vibrio zhanjiangensis]|uniref:Site-specific DNA-methyltransferase (adenine-specific) n=1 Tax=Vibrio zhanjiangensis TaxID=1046128 RepID=A0ABQ6EU94_9VIBR|nr:N-6 DNA methylase [Vibrio zhanjiangensis]GLT16562.1 hypothetical protein GCM10007938_03380 [Vibrio zhanjiangensis]